MFLKLDDLADRLVGKAARGARPVIRWPRAVTVFKRGCNEVSVGAATITVGVLSSLAALLMLTFSPLPLWPSVLVSEALFVVGAALVYFGIIAVGAGRNDKEIGRSKIVSQLFSKDPYLDLQAAAFLTVGAMPEWLKRKAWTWQERWRWRGTRCPGEPYTAERAGLDYLELVSRIELEDEAPDGSFHGKSFPSVDYRLPGSLKNVVVEIVLFLSSLPDAGKPDGETMKAVMDTIDRLATIDGESFTESVHRRYEEEEDKARADYNSRIMDLVDATRNTLAVRNDDQYKALMHSMDRLSELSKQTPHVQPLSCPEGE